LHPLVFATYLNNLKHFFVENNANGLENIRKFGYICKTLFIAVCR